jgi:magnesium transporter
MSSHLIDREGGRQLQCDRADLERRLRSGEFFWVDFVGPSEAELKLLRDVFEFHPLALEDSEHFGQRPKLDEYDDFVFLVVYGWAPDEDGLVEVHCFYSEHYLVTVRRDDAPAFAGLRSRAARRGDALPSGVLLLHAVVDALVDSFFPALTTVDERLTLIDEELLSRPREEHVRDIFTMKRRLSHIQRAIGPQRDLFARVVTGTVALPGMTADAERYFRDAYDHLIRLGETIDGYRDLTTSAIDLYLSIASNRQNAVMKQLTVIATIFLPLSFVAGFFGQNFGWMVEHVDSWAAFLVFGIGFQLLTVGLLLLLFRKRGWF